MTKVFCDICDEEITEEHTENYNGREYEFQYRFLEKPVVFRIVQKFNGCSNTGNLCLSCLKSAVRGAIEQAILDDET